MLLLLRDCVEGEDRAVAVVVGRFVRWCHFAPTTKASFYRSEEDRHPPHHERRVPCVCAHKGQKL